MDIKKIASHIPGTLHYRRRGAVAHLLFFAAMVLFYCLTVQAWAIALGLSTILVFLIIFALSFTMKTSRNGVESSKSLLPPSIRDKIFLGAQLIAGVVLVLNAWWFSAAFYWYWLYTLVVPRYRAHKAAKSAPAP